MHHSRPSARKVNLAATKAMTPDGPVVWVSFLSGPLPFSLHCAENAIRFSSSSPIGPVSPKVCVYFSTSMGGGCSGRGRRRRRRGGGEEEEQKWRRSSFPFTETAILFCSRESEGGRELGPMNIRIFRYSNDFSSEWTITYSNYLFCQN